MGLNIYFLRLVMIILCIPKIKNPYQLQDSFFCKIILAVINLVINPIDLITSHSHAYGYKKINPCSTKASKPHWHTTHLHVYMVIRGLSAVCLPMERQPVPGCTPYPSVMIVWQLLYGGHASTGSLWLLNDRRRHLGFLHGYLQGKTRFGCGLRYRFKN